MVLLSQCFAWGLTSLSVYNQTKSTWGFNLLYNLLWLSHISDKQWIHRNLLRLIQNSKLMFPENPEKTHFCSSALDLLSYRQSAWKSGSWIQVISKQIRTLTPPRALDNTTEGDLIMILLIHDIISETICTNPLSKNDFLSLVMILLCMVGLKCGVRAVCASHRAFHESVWAPAGYKCQQPPSAISYCTSWLENAMLHWRHKTFYFIRSVSGSWQYMKIICLTEDCEAYLCLRIPLNGLMKASFCCVFPNANSFCRQFAGLGDSTLLFFFL